MSTTPPADPAATVPAPRRTRTGEVSLKVSSFTLLAKSLRPLPLGKEETDPETGERRVHELFIRMIRGEA